MASPSVAGSVSAKTRADKGHAALQNRTGECCTGGCSGRGHGGRGGEKIGGCGGQGELEMRSGSDWKAMKCRFPTVGSKFSIQVVQSFT